MKSIHGLRTLALSAAFLASLASGCETTNQGGPSNKETGALVGGFIGAVLGAALNTGGGFQDAGAAIGGAIAGAIVGGLIGAQLDEVDKQKAANAVSMALDLPKNETVQWKSAKPNVNGSATVVTEPTTVSEKKCREVREVVIIDGKESSQISRYCKSSSTGKWAIES